MLPYEKRRLRHEDAVHGVWGTFTLGTVGIGASRARGHERKVGGACRGGTIRSLRAFLRASRAAGEQTVCVMDEVVELLRQTVRDPPGSTGEARELEAALRGNDGGLPQLEDFLEALALYQPTDSPDHHLIGYKELRSAAFRALHDLDDHSHCLHDVWASPLIVEGSVMQLGRSR